MNNRNEKSETNRERAHTFKLNEEKKKQCTKNTRKTKKKKKKTNEITKFNR